MFYLSNRKIKLFIISILLLIFCFILSIFDVKAYSYDLLELNKINLGYSYEFSGMISTPSTDFNSLDFDKYTYYDIFFGHIKENVGTENAYSEIRGYVNHDGNLPINYFSFIVYSPTQLHLGSVCLKGNVSYCNSDINSNSINSPQITEIKLNTTSDHYFYIIGYYGQVNNINGFFDEYSFSWLDPLNLSNLVVTTPNVYAISNLYVFSSLSDRDEFIQSTYDYFSSVTDEDPELPDNPILSPYIDTSGWGSDIGGWVSSFDSSQATITDLVTMPITLLRAILNNLNSSCSTYTLGTLYNTSIVLPCITLSNYLGSGLVTTIDLLLAGLIIFKIGKRFVAIFDDFTNLRDKQISELYGGGK